MIFIIATAFAVGVVLADRWIGQGPRHRRNLSRKVQAPARALYR